jgi:hypothetical protein
VVLAYRSDDGLRLRPKHVERLTENNKVLYKVSSLSNFFKKEEESFHQKKRLKFKEETNKLLHLQRSFV